METGSLASSGLTAAARKPMHAFQATWGSEPTVLTFSPGRVNLIGEHTDYNEGFVMPFAIRQGIYVAAQATDTSLAEICTDAPGQASSQFSLTAPIAKDGPPWSLYVRGVAQGLLDAGIQLPGFRAFISGDLPAGGGLSSSAALEVSTALAMLQVVGATLDPTQLALICQQAEHRYADTPCGIMDQFAVTFGKKDHVLQLDCRTQAISQVPMAAGAPKLLVLNSMVKHTLNDGGYKVRRASCEAAAATLGLSALRDATLAQVNTLADPTTQQRARHVVSENKRCLEAAEALKSGQWDRLGQLLYASHASLRDDFTVSCDELDLIVDLASQIGLSGGVYGCRMTGGGFGGCCVALVQPAKAQEVAQQIAKQYETRTGIKPVAFVAEPSAGARVLL